MNGNSPMTKLGWLPGDPLMMRAALNRAWGWQSTNGTKTAEFCPMCNAMVPYEDSHEPKQVHIDYHVKLAEHIASLEHDDACAPAD